MKNCKFCGAEMEDDQSLCPGCGKDQAAEVTPDTQPVEETKDAVSTEAEQPAETKKSGAKPTTVAIAVAAVVLVAAIAVGFVVNGMGKKPELLPENGETRPVADTTEATEAPTIPADGNPEDVTCKGSYTVSDEQAIAARDQVVATAGSDKLTNGQLQVHYWLGVQQFYAQYGSYAQYLGLDHAQPMDTQVCTMTEGQTWQQYFLAEALNQWQMFTAVAQSGEKNGFRLSEEIQKDLDKLEEGLAETAKANGFDDVEHMLKVNFGNAVTLRDYQDFWKLYYTSSGYYNEVQSSQEVTDADIEGFFAENEAAYQENGLTKDTRTIDVRHILITPENQQEDGTYSDESWAQAEKKAQELLETYQKGDKTEESFAALATEHTQDPGSKENGGLYEKVQQGQMVEAFDAWCFEPNRAVGDTGLVKTNYGYHVMYFAGSETVWQNQVKQDILAKRAMEFVEGCLTDCEADFDYSAIKLALVDMT